MTTQVHYDKSCKTKQCNTEMGSVRLEFFLPENLGRPLGMIPILLLCDLMERLTVRVLAQHLYCHLEQGLFRIQAFKFCQHTYRAVFGASVEGGVVCVV